MGHLAGRGAALRIPVFSRQRFLDFVGPRNRSGRLPSVREVDLSVSRPWRFRKYKFRAGIKVYNLLGVDADRDIQNNLTSPNYGTSYNPLQRSIGLVFGSGEKRNKRVHYPYTMESQPRIMKRV